MHKLHIDNIKPDSIENYIVSDGSFKYPTITTKHPFVLDGVAFIICKSGEGKVRINFREYIIKENTIVIILPFFIVEFLEKDNLNVEFFVFSVEFISGFGLQDKINFDILQKIILNPCLQVSDKDTDVFLDFHSFIVRQYRRENQSFKETIAKNLLSALFAEIGAVYLSNKETDIIPTRQGGIVNNFFKLLIKHHREHRSVSFYADKMSLSPKYLTTLVKKRTGKTILSWINDAVVLSAKYLLKTTSCSVAEISGQLNFPNPSFFGALFKKITGITPQQYRNAHIKK